MPDIQISALQGHSFGAYCALPPSGRGPGMLVIQEIFGVNAGMRAFCDAYAAQGYVAICPDLFWRQQPGVQLTDQSPAEWERAMALYKGFDVEAGVRDLLSTLAHIRRMKECSGKVGTVGYCLGGKLAFLMSTRSDVDASVGYYGVDLDKYLDEVPEIRMPLMLHIAALDKYTPADVRARLSKAFARNPEITAYVYEGADHAFARAGGQHYDKDAAELANKRTAEFFAKNLRS